MQIIDLRPEPAGSRVLARFDIQLTDDCRLYDLALVRMADGRLRTFAPNARGRRTATFTTRTADTITRAAGVAYSGKTAHDQRGA